MQRHRSISLSLGRLAFIQSHRSSDPREVLRGERPKWLFAHFGQSKWTPAERPCQAGKPESGRLDPPSVCLTAKPQKVFAIDKQNPGAVAPGLLVVCYTCAMNFRNCSLPSAVHLYTPACSSTLANTRPVSYWTMSQALSLVMDSYLLLKPSAQSACLAVVS